MKLRYEIIDKNHPTWKGTRFSTLDRAQRELAHAVPAGRFYIKDRTTGTEVTDETDPAVQAATTLSPSALVEAAAAGAELGTCDED